jgi:AraC family transcriptional regulator
MLHESDTRMKSSWTMSGSEPYRSEAGSVSTRMYLTPQLRATTDAVHPVGSTESSSRPVLAGLLAALRLAIDDDRDSPEERLRRASAILGAVEEGRQSRGCVRGGLAPWQARKVASHIDTNLGSPITIESLARIARLSGAHFSRAFRTSFGDPPVAYIIRRRVERAQDLMLSTDASLSQITHDCGFVDQAYLCKLFRRFVGESPGAWRRARFNGAGSSSPGCDNPATLGS